MKPKDLLLIVKIISLLTIGPIFFLGNFGLNLVGGFVNCPFPLPFIMCNFCPIFCTFGQIRNFLFYSLIGLNFLMGKVFCGFICPAGISQELLFKIPGKKITIPQALNQKLKYGKYILAILVIVLILEATRLWTGLPLIDKLWLFLIGQSGELRIFRLVAFGIALILAPFITRSWCRYICPLGTWMAPFNHYSFLEIRSKPGKCLSCGLCHQNCSGDLNPSEGSSGSPECLRCLECYRHCQANVYQIRFRLKKGENNEKEI